MSEETLERLVDTYLFYSYPHSVFVFQGGEPTLAGPAFFEKLCDLQRSYGRNGQCSVIRMFAGLMSRCTIPLA